MKQYLELCQHVMQNGTDKFNKRTGHMTRGVFGYMSRYDLSKGFPLMTTKKLHIKSILHELLWMLAGDTNIKYLHDNKVTIWDEWADENGDLGPVYGAQWRNFNGQGVDQIQNAIDALKKDPSSRQNLVVAWNPAQIKEMHLPPCHCLFQFWVSPDNKLSVLLYQRSCDTFLGVPFNIAQYSFLTHMIAHVLEMEVGEFVHMYGDLHIYDNHMDQIREQLTREPRALPQLVIKRKVDNIFDFKFEDFEITGYDPHPSIKGDVAV